MSLRTIHKSQDQLHTIAIDESGKFYLCRFNFETGKYRKLHKFGTDYESIVALSQMVHNRPIHWDYSPVPEQLSLFDYMESLSFDVPNPAKSSIFSRVLAFVGGIFSW